MKKIKKVIILLIIMCSFFCLIRVRAEEHMTLKVLVIEINPILETVQNRSFYPNNDGHPYVSEYFGQDRLKAINEMKKDIEEMSHGYVSVEFVKMEYLNEFPTYLQPVTLVDGSSANRLDEETYISMGRSSRNRDVGSWIDLIYYPDHQPEAYSFDYGYIMNKFDLVNRRNAGEFDQVWLNTIDPVSTYETIMVGSNPYWINGTPITADCDNFMIANVSISRRDANLHAYGHSSEFVMNMVYNREVLVYGKYYHDSDPNDYQSLNVWNRFSMINSESEGQNAGVGNVHFPFNGEADYDYTNSNSVYTTWRDWLNYPNLTGNKELSNSDAWLYFPENMTLGDDQDHDPDRLYMRFWYYLMPHVEGRTVDGYYNNWWKYIMTLDYVTEVKQNDDYQLKVNVGENVRPRITLVYNSGYTEEYREIIEDKNVRIIGDSVKFENGILKAEKIGNSFVTLCFDGTCVEYNVISTNPSSSTMSTFLIVLIIIFTIGTIAIFVISYIKRKKKNTNY